MAFREHSSTIGRRLQPGRIPLGGARLADRLWTVARAHPLIALALLLAFAFFEIQMSILVATALARPTSYSDPFIQYEMIAPGQPVAGLRQYGCDLSSDMWIRGGSIACRPEEQPNGLVLLSATTTNHEAIHQLSFRAYEVYVGDLIERLGQPDSVKKHRGLFYARWEEGVAAFVDPVSSAAEFIDLLPVVSVIVEPSG